MYVNSHSGFQVAIRLCYGPTVLYFIKKVLNTDVSVVQNEMLCHDPHVMSLNIGQAEFELLCPSESSLIPPIIFSW